MDGIRYQYFLRTSASGMFSLITPISKAKYTRMMRFADQHIANNNILVISEVDKMTKHTSTITKHGYKFDVTKYTIGSTDFELIQRYTDRKGNCETCAKNMYISAKRTV